MRFELFSPVTLPSRPGQVVQAVKAVLSDSAPVRNGSVDLTGTAYLGLQDLTRNCISIFEAPNLKLQLVVPLWP
jgi:hypothetical protein